jgi:hypothetical protein
MVEFADLQVGSLDNPHSGNHSKFEELDDGFHAPRTRCCLG